MGFCPEGVLSRRSFVQKRFCPGGVLTGRGFVLKRVREGRGFLSERVYLGGVLSLDDHSVYTNYICCTILKWSVNNMSYLHAKCTCTSSVIFIVQMYILYVLYSGPIIHILYFKIIKYVKTTFADLCFWPNCINNSNNSTPMPVVLKWPDWSTLDYYSISNSITRALYPAPYSESLNQGV